MRRGIKRLLALLLGVALIAGAARVLPSQAEIQGTLRGAGKNTWKKVNGTYRNAKNQVIPGASKRGIDVSKWQKSIDWARVKKSDISFAIIRCGYIKNGKAVTDPKWRRNANECKKKGIPFGTYLYSYATTTTQAKKEAWHVLRLVKGYRLRYPIYLDMENEVQGRLSKKQLAAVARAFCSTIEKAGYEAGIYANYNWFTTKLTDNYFNGKDRWVARYNNYCGFKGAYNVWQCTSTYRVPGISGNVDLNFQIGTKPPAEVKKLRLSSGRVKLYCGQKKKLTTAVSPKNAYNAGAKFSTSNKAAATVASDGTIRAAAPGKATITAKAADGCGAKAVCTVEVIGITFDKASQVLDKGKTLKLKAKHSASKKALRVTEWKTSNKKIATVNKDGVIKAVNYGTVTITAVNGKLSGTCRVTVKRPVSSVKLNKSSMTLVMGKSTTLKATVYPANATFKTVKWTSSSSAVAKVNAKGQITALAPGRAEITATADNKKATCTVYVLPAEVKSFQYELTEASRVQLNWKLSKGADGYTIYRYDSETKMNIAIYNAGGMEASCVLERQSGDEGAEFMPGDCIIYRIAPYKMIDGKKYYGSLSSVTVSIRLPEPEAEPKPEITG